MIGYNIKIDPFQKQVAKPITYPNNMYVNKRD